VLGLDTGVKGAVVYRPIGQMPSQKDTRKHLVQTALRLFASRGYYNTGIADILRESGCKRGTLYYYFSSKEDLGYAAIDESVRLVVEREAASHLLANEHPIDRLLAVLDDLPSPIELETTGTPSAGVAARMAAVHEGFRQRVEGHVEAMIERVEEIVRKGIADGQITDSVEPDELAHMFTTMGMGIQFESQLMRREAIWRNAKRWLKDYLNSLRR
jgi:TetR/AcrR family transcriptional repressor of nem operon